MRYGKFEQMKAPMRSGAVESMIRQIINLRLKGCGKFWKRENAERMLLLRSFFVTGRLDDLFEFALERRVAWWKNAIDEDSCGSQEVVCSSRLHPDVVMWVGMFVDGMTSTPCGYRLSSRRVALITPVTMLT